MHLGSTHRARISPCGRFVAASGKNMFYHLIKDFDKLWQLYEKEYKHINKIISGFTPDVNVWEVMFNKSGEFKQVFKAFDLAGHTSGIHDFSFNADSSHMATVSKDGTYRFYDTKSNI